MTATDELRRLLDERGARWWEEDGHTLWYGESIHHAASAFSSFLFGENERVHLNAMVTPEQAVEATLGRGTCKAVYSPNGVYCSVCHGGGLTIPRRGVNALRNYCPNCGRKIDGRKVVSE